jgi:hypothetical protein
MEFLKNQNRRKFLLAGLTLTALWTTLKFWNKPEEKKSMKFLTEDGKLVEVDINKLPSAKKAVSKAELQNWVSKKSNPL